jgi:hypothetical protein
MPRGASRGTTHDASGFAGSQLQQTLSVMGEILRGSGPHFGNGYPCDTPVADLRAQQAASVQ